MYSATRLRSIADDHQRTALIRWAITKGREQARGDFVHTLLVDGLDDDTLTLFAQEAWQIYARQVEFDYPQFAESLCLKAYRLAYRTCLRNLAHGMFHNDDDLVAIVQAEAGIAPV